MEAVLAARRIHKNETIATHAVERLFSVCLGKNWNPRTKFSYQTYMLLRANGAILQMLESTWNKKEFWKFLVPVQRRHMESSTRRDELQTKRFGLCSLSERCFAGHRQTRENSCWADTARNEPLPSGLYVQIMKSLYGLLRISWCAPTGDCHSFTKIVSKQYDREIVSRFHFFQQGLWSRHDHW